MNGEGWQDYHADPQPVGERHGEITMSEWRLINSPPEDGETVLGYWRNGEQHTGSVWEGKWVPAWEHQNDNWDMPTHWKPLDDGPTA